MPDLELGRPPPNLPDGEEEFGTDLDLSVAGVVHPARTLSLPGRNESVAKWQIRLAVLGVIPRAFDESSAPGTPRTSEALLKSRVS